MGGQLFGGGEGVGLGLCGGCLGALLQQQQQSMLQAQAPYISTKISVCVCVCISMYMEYMCLYVYMYIVGVLINNDRLSLIVRQGIGVWNEIDVSYVCYLIECRCVSLSLSKHMHTRMSSEL
jgi:hypothetical protein